MCVLCRYVLPVEPNVQKLVHVFYTQPSFIAPYAKVRKEISIVRPKYENRMGARMWVLFVVRLVKFQSPAFVDFRAQKTV